MFTHIQKGGLLLIRTGQVGRYEQTISLIGKKSLLFTHIQNGGLLLIRTGQARRYEQTIPLREKKSLCLHTYKRGDCSLSELARSGGSEEESLFELFMCGREGSHPPPPPPPPRSQNRNDDNTLLEINKEKRKIHIVWQASNRIEFQKNEAQADLTLWTDNPVLQFQTNLQARNQVGIGLSYRTARLHRLVESIPWNRFLDALKV